MWLDVIGRYYFSPFSSRRSGRQQFPNFGRPKLLHYCTKSLGGFLKIKKKRYNYLLVCIVISISVRSIFVPRFLFWGVVGGSIISIHIHALM